MKTERRTVIKKFLTPIIGIAGIGQMPPADAYIQMDCIAYI